MRVDSEAARKLASSPESFGAWVENRRARHRARRGPTWIVREIVETARRDVRLAGTVFGMLLLLHVAVAT